MTHPSHAAQPDLSGLDLFADSPENAAVPDSPALASVNALVTEWDKITNELKKLEELTATRAARKLQIERESLPLAMTEVGINTFTTPTGRSVEVVNIVNGGIPALSTIEKARGSDRQVLEARRKAALDVIRQKWPGLLKTEVSVSLGKGAAGVATRIVELIRNQFNLSPSVDETVHHATLNAHFRELMEQGKLGDIPVEPFALYVGPIAKIK